MYWPEIPSSRNAGLDKSHNLKEKCKKDHAHICQFFSLYNLKYLGIRPATFRTITSSNEATTFTVINKYEIQEYINL